MLEKEYGRWFVVCDICGATEDIELEYSNSGNLLFENAHNWLRHQGWKITTTDYGYKHICPDCAGVE